MERALLHHTPGMGQGEVEKSWREGRFNLVPKMCRVAIRCLTVDNVWSAAVLQGKLDEAQSA